MRTCASVQDCEWEDLFAPFRDSSASEQKGPAVFISVLGLPFALSLQDVTTLSKAQFAVIFTVSADATHSLLLVIDQYATANPDSACWWMLHYIYILPCLPMPAVCLVRTHSQRLQ